MYLNIAYNLAIELMLINYAFVQSQGMCGTA